MLEILGTPKISVGLRIVLPKDLCDIIDVKVGDRVVIVRDEHNNMIIKPNRPIENPIA